MNIIEVNSIKHAYEHIILTIEIKFKSKKNKFITLYTCTFMRKRGKIGGEEDRIIHVLYHIYSFKNKQIYFNHFNHKDEKR